MSKSPTPRTTSTPGRATPHKLTKLDRALIYTACQLGAPREHVARSFGISVSRLYAVVREEAARRFVREEAGRASS